MFVEENKIINFAEQAIYHLQITVITVSCNRLQLSYQSMRLKTQTKLRVIEEQVKIFALCEHEDVSKVDES